MNHVANAASVLCNASYVHTDGWPIISLKKKITGACLKKNVMPFCD